MSSSKASTRPTHISIIGSSKYIFSREVPQEIHDQRFADLIMRLAPGPTILLSDRVKSGDDIAPLISYLQRKGVSREDIRVRYPAETGSALVERAIARGLSASGLTFGADVAERDDNLRRYFISTTTFQAVSAHKKHIIVGPKGSGKSAILRELSAGARSALVITPEHYATEVLETLKKHAGANDLAAYVTTWKYTLLVELFRKLVQTQLGDARALSELRKYLADHGHLAGELTLSERFLVFLRRVSQIKGKVGPVEGELGVETADALSKFFKMDEILGLVPSLQKVLRRADFTVYLDELDQSWTNTETANLFLISLLTAAIQLRGLSENLHVVVFLRSEIFDLLKPYLPQLDKLRSDIATIQWSRRELTNLIASRALDSLAITEDLQAEETLRVIFPGAVDRSGLTAFEYLVSRTSLRPREVIQFCNLALSIAEQEQTRAVGVDAVLRAEEQFSAWKLEYVVAENIYIHPRLDDLLERFRGKSRRVEFAAMDHLLTSILLDSEQRAATDTWARPEMESMDLLRLLYSIEVIGIERTEPAREPRQHIWESYDFVFGRPKGRPEQSSSFLFHPGLWRTLELV